MTKEIKIVCIFDACGQNKSQCVIPMGEVFTIEKICWDCLDYIELSSGNKNYGSYSKIFFKTLAEYRDYQIDEILKD